MAIIRWDPFRNVATLQDRINRLFDESFPGSKGDDDAVSMCAWRPNVDIYESVEGVVIKADLPGVPKDKVVIEVKDNILTLHGDRNDETCVQEENYYRKERCCGTFHRAFTLQHAVEPESIKARFKDGVLEITIPKPEIEQPTTITVDID
ncbi:MAG: Hsp20/alpha crystallin family protein [Desulfobacteraceae bacterium]|nr:Hsp20/alpha crystallin family protein [Desulfobacteraceae bacterium]